MEVQAGKNIRSLQMFYLIAFFGTGSIATLLSVYLANIEKLTGTQIGIVLSIGPIMMIFFQPLWGMVSDLTNSPPKVLSATTLLAGFLGLGFLAFHQYSYLVLTAVCVAIFQSAIIPVSDSISVKYAAKVHYNYGNIRLFGSLGFGLAVFIMGRLSEWNPAIIFYSFFCSLCFASLLSFRIPQEKSLPPKAKLLSGLKELLHLKKFIVFLLITFLIFGPNLANNVYFGLFIDRIGGSYSGIGFAFLIAVFSEIPFMRISERWIAKLGLLPVVMLAGIVSCIRWIFYFFEPNLMLVYLSTAIQGFSIGLFIPAGLQYIRNITPKHITVTAITIYSAIGNGLGNWFSTFFGGMIYDKYSVFSVYLFFAFLAVLGVLINLWLMKEEKVNVAG